MEMASEFDVLMQTPYVDPMIGVAILEKDSNFDVLWTWYAPYFCSPPSLPYIYMCVCVCVCVEMGEKRWWRTRMWRGGGGRECVWEGEGGRMRVSE